MLRLKLEEMAADAPVADGELAPLGQAPPPRAGRAPLLPPREPTGVAPAELGATADPFAALDHPAVGGRLTVFVLGYGSHPDLARRCVDGILRTVPAHRLDLRIALNAPCAETVEYVRTVPATRVYVYALNSFKYPVMREIFRDPACPIATPYVAWFDDDSYVVDPLWAARLGEAVGANHDRGVRLYGIRFCHDLASLTTPTHDPRSWFRSASWYRGRGFGSRRGEEPAPGGSVLHFVTGGFWALATDMISIADIPDGRLRHNGGDIAIGEQVRQAGFRMLSFNHGKALIHSSGAPRRGHSEAFPWAPS